MALTPRWTELRDVPEQQAYWSSPHRFNVVPAGRRSGKTELGKRKLVKRALVGTEFDDPRYFAAAPTRDQAKRIFWDDLKRMVPENLRAGRPKETELSLEFVNGSSIWVVGMDKPERIEGQPWDGGVLDEYANMKPKAWGENVRPALSDRLGWCDLIGVPEGRNHYYDVAQDARVQQLEHGPESEWGHFHWVSAKVLPPEEIAAARRDLDDLTFRQEYEASFVVFVGQAYYPFDRQTHTVPGLASRYDPRQPLILCFDFNVAPGTAAIGQEMKIEQPDGTTEEGTAVIGEVWIPRNSNTPAVCRKILADWGDHEGPVYVYGDATGGARGSAKTEGSDWDLVKRELAGEFTGRIYYRVPASNPTERSRVNAMNTRLESGDGRIRLVVDPSAAPHVVKDLEGVRLLEGGSGEIDKKRDPMLTHPSDAIGYYVVREYPVVKRKARVVEHRV